MNRVFIIYDENDNVVVTRRNNPWCYKTLGVAKMAAKQHIKYRNQRLPKEDRIQFEDYLILEYELLEKDRHIL